MTATAPADRQRAGILRWALVLVPAVLVAGLLSGRLSGSGPGNPWFDSLAKPSLYPPPATFGIAWTALYLMMGVALAIVMAAPRSRARSAAIGAFLIQLCLNLAWSPLFFAGHRIAAAQGLLVGIDVAVLVTILLFWRVRKAAALLLVPYLAWVLFATVLNAQFLSLNPQADASSASQQAD